MEKVQNPVILSVIHHCQNHLESTTIEVEVITTCFDPYWVNILEAEFVVQYGFMLFFIFDHMFMCHLLGNLLVSILFGFKPYWYKIKLKLEFIDN
jgi:hypothetical protein